MDFSLPKPITAIQGVARDLAQEVLRERAAERDASETFPLEEARMLAERGLMGVAIDPAYGGLGLGKIGYAAAIREIAASCASTAVTMAVTNMVGEMIDAYGTDAQKETYLPLLLSGQNPIGSFCLSEAQSGTDAAALRTKAVRDGDSYRLTGTKMWVTSGAHCSLALIMARTDETQKNRGITSFLVDPQSPGYSVGKAEEKMGLRGSNTVSVNLDDCVVDAGRVLAGEGRGFYVAMTALDGGRIGIGAQSLGIARNAVEAAARLIKNGRKRTQSVEKNLADAATALDAGWLMVLRAAYLREQGQPMTREAAMAKVYATESACKAVEYAHEIVGGTGTTEEWTVERAMRDVRITRIYEGTSEIQRHVIARELLKGKA